MTATLPTLQPFDLLKLVLDGLLQNLPLFICVGLLAVVIKVLKCRRVKGKIGEAAVNWGGLSRFEKKQYRVLKNLIIPSVASDGTNEIDHVVVSAYGIFVIETKNHGGWIFGGEHDRNWTVSHFGKKFQFLNPVRQNKRHVESLAIFLQLPQGMFHSVIFFVGDAKLKTPMPPNVLTAGLIRYIEGKREVLLTDDQVEAVSKLLADHDSGMNKRAAMREHVRRCSARAT